MIIIVPKKFFAICFNLDIKVTIEIVTYFTCTEIRIFTIVGTGSTVVSYY